LPLQHHFLHPGAKAVAPMNITAIAATMNMYLVFISDSMRELSLSALGKFGRVHISDLCYVRTLFG
jgi:hypothetical protein